MDKDVQQAMDLMARSDRGGRSSSLPGWIFSACIRPIRTAAFLCLLLSLAAPSAFAADISVIGEMTKELTLQPGGTAEGEIVLENTGGEIQLVKVYQTDYVFRADGTNSYQDPGRLSRSNSSWITYSPQQLTVAPKEKARIRYSIAAPAQEQLVGTYWSVLMVEPLTGSSPELALAQGKELRVGSRTVHRYGIQIVTNIGEAGKREIRFARHRELCRDGRRFLEVDLENTGERWLRPVVWAELYDKKGALTGRFESSRHRIYPGCSARFEVDLGKLPRGDYAGLIVADNGDEWVFGARYKLRFQEECRPAPQVVAHR